ncbi:uncharacterized protein EDB91DRAFT_1079374 [Suillus paluster]|uniref:uncharacterized protein n=1 Tax=Suillus paluster TaxID=48578 RepID=UPI001B87AC15|nr:uncharacterized protein EDB91DRAFT_1079374 [Suillus paluster]KAG1748410.1 hypothetical protein EDB91DRAFT_1079374 [Suillus paluster]
MAIVSPGPGYIDLGMINSASYFTTNATSDLVSNLLNVSVFNVSVFVSNLLNVLNISSRFSSIILIAWQRYVQGTIFTLPTVRMLCALGSDGQLKDASAIDWYNDPDDDSPMLAPPPPPASNGKLTAFVSHHSGRAVKPTEKIHEAINTAPAAPQGQPAPKRVQAGRLLSVDEWTKLQLMRDVLQEPANAQQSFSATREPTIWHTIPVLEFLQETWQNMANCSKFDDFSIAINSGLDNLRKWYHKIDESDVYFICLGCVREE